MMIALHDAHSWTTPALRNGETSNRQYWCSEDIFCADVALLEYISEKCDMRDKRDINDERDIISDKLI